MFTYKVYAGKDCFKTKRIRKNNKVFSSYRSMIEKETEKINRAALKYIIMFVVIIGLAGVMFKFVFLYMILGNGILDVSVLEVSLPDKERNGS